jgi:CheY-like chemotaxis protein
MVLTSTAHQVRVAPNGEEAWAMYQEEPVPIVLSDWSMPKMDGLALCRNIRRYNGYQYTYFILLTGNAGRDKYLEAMDAGVDDFLRKPMDQADLLNRLRVADRILTSTARIKRLESLLPICSYCKRIRESPTEWLPIDEYMAKHADAEFSHGICPSCLTEQVQPELGGPL